MSKSNGSLTCSHYKTKKCSRFYFPCCDIVDPCVRCHLERDKCDDKTKPRLLSCNECNLEQEISNQCMGCYVKFDNYFLWYMYNLEGC